MSDVTTKVLDWNTVFALDWYVRLHNHIRDLQSTRIRSITIKSEFRNQGASQALDRPYIYGLLYSVGYAVWHRETGKVVYREPWTPRPPYTGVIDHRLAEVATRYNDELCGPMEPFNPAELDDVP